MKLLYFVLIAVVLLGAKGKFPFDKKLIEAEFSEKYTIVEGSDLGGDGTHAVIKEVIVKNTNPEEMAAIKMPDMSEPDNKAAIENEIKIHIDVKKRMLSLRHHNLSDFKIVDILNYGTYKEKPFLVLTLFGMNLKNLMKLKYIDTTMLKKLGLDMVTALEALHSIGYIHKDVDERNIAMSKGNESTSKPHATIDTSFYLCDLGESVKYVDENDKHLERKTHFQPSRRYDINGLALVLTNVRNVIIESFNPSMSWSKPYDTNDVVQRVPANEKLIFHCIYEYLNKELYNTQKDEEMWSAKPNYNLLKNCFA